MLYNCYIMLIFYKIRFMRDIIRKTIAMRSGQKNKRNDIIDLVIRYRI